MDWTIVTPSRNQLKWLRLCRASVADQAGVTVQHIVQDAGSTDGTVEWLHQQPGIEAHIEADEGMYDALNRGFARATGDFVAWLNCDEQYLPGVLARVAKFFRAHAGVDMVFGDIIVVDECGEYLWHRKVQVPRLYHTLTCHLSTLSCAMFFRRRLVEADRFRFDTSYRIVGDAEWMTRLLRAGVRMAALGEFTSVFTQTGQNLSRDARAAAEQARLAATASPWVRLARPLWILHHRLARWRAGAYRQTPFSFQLHMAEPVGSRVARRVAVPRFRPVAGRPGCR
ncbi:MAG: glycosyltransferase family 2 protein [Limisphaerales bacterium]